MFAAQTRLRSILSGRFTFKFGSFNWIRFMITSLCPFTYCTYNPEKVSRYYDKNIKKYSNKQAFLKRLITLIEFEFENTHLDL